VSGYRNKDQRRLIITCIIIIIKIVHEVQHGYRPKVHIKIYMGSCGSGRIIAYLASYNIYNAPMRESLTDTVDFSAVKRFKSSLILSDLSEFLQYD